MTDALVHMNIDDDDLSDENDSDEDARQTRSARQQAREPKAKYIDMLQSVANRQRDEIIIDLDDLSEVYNIVEVRSVILTIF